MEWIEKYPKKVKPAYNELLEFLQPHIREMFLLFDTEMNVKYKVHNKYHRYLSTAGWAYGYGRSYNCELLTVTIHNDCFRVLGIPVKDDETLQKALDKVKEAYEDGFEARYAEISAKRRENQIERSKKRVEREKHQMEKITESIDIEKFNKFNWCRKVSRSDLLRLYNSDAKGMLDEELADKVGYTFYVRCKQAKEARELMDKGQMLCLQCEAVLKTENASPAGAMYVSFWNNMPVKCECGYSYTYREYRRSCNAANMPGGRATPIFESYIKKWPSCKEASQKMMLIDWLIHECHVTLMSGSKGRSVCINLIEGSLKQISDLIIKLAYGSNE